MKLLFILVGCAHGPPPPTTEAVEQPPTYTAVPLDDSLAYIASVQADLDTLDPQERAALASAITTLDVTCPYTRLAHQLAIGLHHELQQQHACLHEAGSDLVKLKRGVAAHVDALDRMGVDLRLPTFHEHLSNMPPGTLVDRSALTSASSPVRASLPLVRSLDDSVRAMSLATRDTIGVESDRARALLGHNPPLDDALRGWISALEQILPRIADPHGRARLEGMLEVLEPFEQMGC